MRTDSTVKTRPALSVHLGDACTKLGSLTYKAHEINKALENDGTYGVPLTGQIIKWFNREGVTRAYITARDPDSTRKRVVVVFLSALPKDLAQSIITGMLCDIFF